MKNNNLKTVEINCNNITDWDTFHDEFYQVFGFAGFYGRNMDAWVDCMSYLSDPDAQMTTVHCEEGRVITLELKNIKAFKTRCPEQYDAIIECSAFVNWRLIENGHSPVLALSFYG